MTRPRPKKPRPAAAGIASARRGVSSVPVYALLVITVLVLFRQVLGYQFVDLDDLSYVVDNPHVASGLTFQGVAWAFTHSYEGYWAPLTWLSYMADARLFGLSAAGFHATNVVIHAASACVLFAALKRMTGAHWASACVAAFFAIHPLHVESVAWIAERKDVLSTLFYFLAIWAYARYVEGPGRARYLLVVALFGCALMSKPMAVTLPVVLLLLDVWPLGRPVASGLVREKVPLFAMSLAVAVLTLVVQNSAGAVVALDVAPPAMRMTNALVSCATYLANMLWPIGLAALYPYPRAVPVWQAAGAAILLAGISVGAVRLRRRAPYLLVGWMWYVVTLLPVLGFIQAGPQARADRYTYVAMTGITIMVVWGIRQLSEGLRHTRVLLAASACVTLAICGALTWRQIAYWRNTESVFRRALAVTTGNYVAHKALGSALRGAGEIDEAVAQLREAVALAPDYADAQSELGSALNAANHPDEAVVHLTHAVLLQPANAGFRVNLGSTLYALARGEAAEAEYREALHLSPASYEAHSGLGLVLVQRGDLEAARAEFAAAIQLNPAYADAYLNLGTALARMGRNDEAAGAFAIFSSLKPEAPDGHIALGTLFARQQRMNEAIAELSIAVRMRPDDADVHSNLGVVLVTAGRIEEAVGQFSEAVRLGPDRPELRSNLDLALAMRAKR